MPNLRPSLLTQLHRQQTTLATLCHEGEAGNWERVQQLYGAWATQLSSLLAQANANHHLGDELRQRLRTLITMHNQLMQGLEAHKKTLVQTQAKQQSNQKAIDVYRQTGR